MNLSITIYPKVHVVACEGPRSMDAAISAVARMPGATILDSAADVDGAGRYSIFAWDPVEEFIRPVADASDWIDALKVAFDRYSSVCTNGAGDLPPCGWYGYIGYEAGAILERCACRSPRELAMPDVRFCFYDAMAVFDHHSNAWFAVALVWPAGSDGGRRRPSVKARVEEIKRLLMEADERVECGDVAGSESTSVVPQANMCARMYLRCAERAQDYIRCGDVYQVNLTQRFSAPASQSAIDTYLRLRAVNPGAYSAYFGVGEEAVLCSSPELFIDVGERRIVTRPIKGTSPRSGDPDHDTASRGHLASSEKDRAELNMIIDLMRNDLGRICEYGSIRVISDGAIEAHPTVFHRVATIEGRLRRDISAVDILRATLPGGSITGCPKIRAMQIIDELEPTRRGVYCGSIGYVGIDGSMKFNIAIRTMIHDGRRLHAYAGGAIVADSDPEAEYEEILAKARGMFAAAGWKSRA